MLKILTKLFAMLKVNGNPGVNAETIYCPKRETQAITGETLVNVAGLGARLTAGASYRVRGSVPFSAGGASSGASFSFKSGAGSHVIRATLHNTAAPEDSVTFILTAQETEVEADLPAGDHWFDFEGQITGAIDGDFQITAAQKTNDAAALSVFLGGFIEFTRNG